MRVVFSMVSKRGFLFFRLIALSPLIMAGRTPFVCMLLEFDSFYFSSRMALGFFSPASLHICILAWPSLG